MSPIARTATAPPPIAGRRRAQPSAASRSATSIGKSPPSCSRASPNGPSVTTGRSPRKRTGRVPSAGFSPAPPSSAPAPASAWLKAACAVYAAAVPPGDWRAQAAPSPQIIRMNRIDLLPWATPGRPGRARAAAIDSGRRATPWPTLRPVVAAGQAGAMETQPSALEVRRAGAEDLDRVVPLFDAYRTFYGQPSQPAACRGFLEARLARGESVLLLACRDGAALGFVQLYPVFSSVRLRPAFLLSDLYVDPAARGSGVVDALLGAAAAHASQAGAAFLLLETGDDNARAQAVYARHGWRRMDPASRFYLKELA